MYRGAYQLGETVGLCVLCRNSAGVPADPDAVVVVDIHGEAGEHVSGRRLPVLDRAATTGLFAGSVYLDDTFAAGEYLAVYRWDISGTRGESTDTFRVVAGGGASGQVVALHHYERPHAEFLVQQRADGNLYKGKNPRA